MYVFYKMNVSISDECMNALRKDVCKSWDNIAYMVYSTWRDLEIKSVYININLFGAWIESINKTFF